MSEVDWLTGVNSVISALEHDTANVEQVVVAQQRDDKRMQRVLELAQAHGVAVQKVSRKELDRLVQGQRHQGVAARYRAHEPLDENQLLQLIEGIDSPLVLVLDHLEDPRNFGACLRSAAAAGADVVVFPKDRAVGLTPVARRAAAGTADFLPLARVVNLSRTLKSLQKAGLWIVGADADGEQTLYDTDLTGPLVMVLGGEGKGLRRLVREHCDFRVNIPMNPQVESLNVSVAAGVMLFEARRQRSAA